MKTTYERVRHHREKFEQPNPPAPTVPPPDVTRKGLTLIGEEFREVCQAVLRDYDYTREFFRRLDHALGMIRTFGHNDFTVDLAELAKELADVDVVVCDMAAAHGIPHDAVSVAVTDSNLSKLGPDGKPIWREDGKYLKGPNYRKPDIRAVLAAAGEAQTPEVLG